MSAPVQRIDLGIVPYRPIEAVQEQLVALRQAREIGDILLLLEHAPVITLGRRANPDHILLSRARLESEGIQVCHTERGGDVTYHGPGQLVGYPIVHLHERGWGASDYMHRLEDVVAAVVEDLGMRTRRREGIIGVWVGNDKIAALGVRIRRGVAYHGFALNVAPDMRHWTYIVPCGITDGGVTSMAREAGRCVELALVRDQVAHHFGRLFGSMVSPGSLESLLGSKRLDEIWAGHGIAERPVAHTTRRSDA